MLQTQIQQQQQDTDSHAVQSQAQTGTDAAMVDAAAVGNYAAGQQATKPKAELGDGPIPGEGAWLAAALAYNKLRRYTAAQWKAIQRHVKTEDDGICGKNTTRGVFRWQAANGLQTDGKIGPQTHEAMKADSAPIPVAIPKAIAVAEPVQEEETTPQPTAPQATQAQAPVNEVDSNPTAAAEETQVAKPEPQLGDAPIPGEQAWLQNAMKFNRMQRYTVSQWKAIQEFIKTQNDGIPGKGTARGVYRWQQSKGLVADGKLGWDTYSFMKAENVSIPKAKPVVEEQNVVQPGPSTDGEPQAQTQAPAADGKRNADVEKDKTQFLAVIDQITSVMETSESKGKYDMLHTLNDGGGISYGKHQVTLTSGTLTKLLDTYLELASKDSANAKTLQQYLSRVRKHDLSLRGEKAFLEALRNAASEKEMVQAQDVTFLGVYGKPAWDAAKDGKISSALGHAMLYDTKIQGGMETLLENAEKKLGGKIGDTVEGVKIDERRFLTVFNDLREARLYRLAAYAEKQGNKTRANMLRNSAYRTASFRQLLQAGNMNVAGAGGDVKIMGPGRDTYKIKGFDTKDVIGPKTGLEGLKVIGKAVIKSQKVNVRLSANVDSDRLETVAKGESFEVYDKRDGWLKIKLNSRSGWVSADLVTFEPAAAAAPAQAQEQQEQGLAQAEPAEAAAE